MRKLIRVASLSAALVTLLTILTVSPVRAASNGLGITPRRDFTVQPGKSVTDTLFVQNLSLNQDLQVELKLIDFGAANESGTPALYIADNAPQTAWSLKPFIKLPQSTKIPAGKSANIPITIAIPAGQGAGSYYSAIQYLAVNPETKEKVNIAASSATLTFVTVPGDAREQLNIKQFGAWQSNANGDGNGIFSSFFFAGAPKELAYRLENSGNVAEQPSGSMIVKNMFGQTVKEIQDANPKKQLVLIGQTRHIQVCIKTSVLESKDPNGQNTQQSICDNAGLLPGRYTAEVALFYDLNGHTTQELSGKISFWYLPWWSLVLLGIVILMIVGLVWLIRRALRGRRTRYRR